MYHFVTCLSFVAGYF